MMWRRRYRGCEGEPDREAIVMPSYLPNAWTFEVHEVRPDGPGMLEARACDCKSPHAAKCEASMFVRSTFGLKPAGPWEEVR